VCEAYAHRCCGVSYENVAPGYYEPRGSSDAGSCSLGVSSGLSSWLPVVGETCTPVLAFAASGSYTIPSNSVGVRVWAVGGGGGGGGVQAGSGSYTWPGTAALSGSCGGGAGGVAYVLWSAAAGDVVSFTLASTGGAGGINLATGTAGGPTSARLNAGTVLFAGGGSGGKAYATSISTPGGTSPGGNFSGGDGGATGGIGACGPDGIDKGGGGGGGIVGAAGFVGEAQYGGKGAGAADVAGLHAAAARAGLTSRGYGGAAGKSNCCEGPTSGSSCTVSTPACGGMAIAFGDGGGGAGW